MRPWTLERALSNKTSSSKWCVCGDFDGNDYGDEYLTLATSDILEQWQTCPDGWAFGRLFHRSHTWPSGQSGIGWYLKPFVYEARTEQ